MQSILQNGGILFGFGQYKSDYNANALLLNKFHK
jgi:hypothetical protein